MNKPRLILLALGLGMVGITGAVMTAQESNVPIQKMAQSNLAQNYGGPVSGQSPEEVQKIYDEMLKESEQQKAEEEAQAQKKAKLKNTKGTANTPAPTGNQPSNSSTSTVTEPSQLQPGQAEPGQTQPEQPTEQSKEPQDFIRGY